MDCPQSGAAHELPVEPAVVMVISATMCEDQIMGAICFVNCNCLYGTYELGGPLSGSWLLRADHRGTD